MEVATWNLADEFSRLVGCGWYWGNLSYEEAHRKMEGLADGAFLVRDSADQCHLFSVTFNSLGITRHVRIQHSRQGFTLYGNLIYASVIKLIEESMRRCSLYGEDKTVPLAFGSKGIPLIMTRPVSRFTNVQSLQDICRFVIRLHTRVDYIKKLPLPRRVINFIGDNPFKGLRE